MGIQKQRGVGVGTKDMKILYMSNDKFNILLIFVMYWVCWSQSLFIIVWCFEGNKFAIFDLLVSEFDSIDVTVWELHWIGGICRLYFDYIMFYILYVMYLEDYIGIVGFRVWGRWCDRLRVTLNWRKLRANNSSSVCLSTTQGKTRSTKDFWEKKAEWEIQFQIEIRVRTNKRIQEFTKSGHDHIEREVMWGVKDGQWTHLLH